MCALEDVAVIDKNEAYDSLDVFCAEYGFDAATKQRMRNDLFATALELESNIVSSQARRFVRASKPEPSDLEVMGETEKAVVGRR